MALSTVHYHYDTFRGELAKAYPAFGHALWEPDPGEYPPVEVGDVGFIREGQFHRLFNALLPEGHESHERFGVPEGHEPLQPVVTDHINRGLLTPNTFYSSGVTVLSGGFGVLAATTTGSAEVSFLCTRKQGAVLSLPVTAQREDTLTRDHFREWIITHIDTWFAFTQRLRLGIEMEDIVLVTGRHRTRSWSNIVFNEVQADAQLSLGVDVAGALGASVNWRASSLRIQGAVLSQGPSGEDLPGNQCIFIRGFRIKRNLFRIPRVRGAAEPKPDPRGNDREPEKEVVPIPGVTEYRDPLHVLLEYIAKRAPHCDMALVHDDDLERFLGADDISSLETLQPDAIMDYLERSKLEIGVISGEHPLVSCLGASGKTSQGTFCPSAVTDYFAMSRLGTGAISSEPPPYVLSQIASDMTCQETFWPCAGTDCFRMSGLGTRVMPSEPSSLSFLRAGDRIFLENPRPGAAVTDCFRVPRLRTGVMPDSWPATCKCPRPEAVQITTTMPSVQLKSSADTPRGKRHRCTTCGVRFAWLQGLQRHRKDKHSPQRQCPFCSSFRCSQGRAYLMKAHFMKVHRDVVSAEVLQVICARRGRSLEKFLDTDERLRRHNAIPQAGASSTSHLPAPAKETLDLHMESPILSPHPLPDHNTPPATPVATLRTTSLEAASAS